MLQNGQSFGRYVVEEVLGSGGMGQVYQAHDSVLHRHVALKLLLGIENRTPDPTLDGTLDAILEAALRRSTLLDPFSGAKLRELEGEIDAQPQSIDEGLGRRLATASAGRVITVRGAVAAAPGGFGLTLRATDAGTGAVVLDRTVTTDAGHIVSSVGELACALRRGAGDVAAPSDPDKAGQTGLSSSIDAIHEWAVGVALNRTGKYADAQTHLGRAVAVDPDFAQARGALGLCLWNESRRAEGDAQIRLAFKWVDRMGERDRLAFLGDYYGTVGDYDRSIDAYRKLLDQWPGDSSAAINLAVTYLQNGSDEEAVKAGRRAADAHPRNVIARSNMTNFYLVASTFEEAVRDGNKVLADFPQPPVSTYANIAAAEVLLGRRDDAIEMLRKGGSIEPHLERFGLADLALYEGRLRDAVKVLEHEVAVARAAHDPTDVQAASAFLAGAQLRLGDRAGAIAAAAEASQSDEVRILFLAAMAFIDAGRPERATAIEAHLSSSLVSDERAAGKLLSAEALRVKGKARDAVSAYQEALRIRESWLGHFGLGVAYLDARAFAEAYAELQTCLARRGEAANYWLPSEHLVPPALYYLARAQEGIGNPEAAATYGQFLALEPEAQGDLLADDARRRMR